MGRIANQGMASGARPAWLMSFPAGKRTCVPFRKARESAPGPPGILSDCDGTTKDALETVILYNKNVILSQE